MAWRIYSPAVQAIPMDGAPVSEYDYWRNYAAVRLTEEYKRGYGSGWENGLGAGVVAGLVLGVCVAMAVVSVRRRGG